MRETAVEARRGVEFYEGEFLVKTLEERDEFDQAYNCDIAVFAETLHWVPPTEDGQEMDMYDSMGRHRGSLWIMMGHCSVWRGFFLPRASSCWKMNLVRSFRRIYA